MTPWAASSAMLDRIEADDGLADRRAFPAPRRPATTAASSSTAVGEEFDALDRLDSVINADVLDAWFPPSPRRSPPSQQHLPRLLRTSPPTGCEGLVRTIARARGVEPDCILPGAGSSDLIFLALAALADAAVPGADPRSDLRRIPACAGARDRLPGGSVGPPSRARNTGSTRAVSTRRLAGGYDLVVLVNPNSPTGQHVPREELERVLRRVAAGHPHLGGRNLRGIRRAGPIAGAIRRPLGERHRLQVHVEDLRAERGAGGLPVRQPASARIAAGHHAALGGEPAGPGGGGEGAARIRITTPRDTRRPTPCARQLIALACSRSAGRSSPSVTNFLLCHLPGRRPGCGDRRRPLSGARALSARRRRDGNPTRGPHPPHRGQGRRDQPPDGAGAQEVLDVAALGTR